MKCFIFHNWEEWKDHKFVPIEKTETSYGLFHSETQIVGYMAIQIRRCRDCNIIQLHHVKSKS